ncbi:hypothetical protein HanIR_Chr10g0461961 [Helianthus annuus]|nr:hypothetical protein HanIR_Chr10g0461961 [Helianthus annuus]
MISDGSPRWKKSTVLGNPAKCSNHSGERGRVLIRRKRRRFKDENTEHVIFSLSHTLSLSRSHPGHRRIWCRRRCLTHLFVYPLSVALVVSKKSGVVKSMGRKQL